MKFCKAICHHLLTICIVITSVGCEKRTQDPEPPATIETRKWVNSSYDEVELYAITIPPKKNVGFELIDIPLAEKEQAFVTNHFSSVDHDLIINGGYFERDFKPVGLCKVAGKTISDKEAPKLSGFVTINSKGTIDLLWKQIDPGQYHHILQSGPYVIDPGGKIGIYRRDGKQAARTLIGKNKNGSIVIIITGPVELFHLAKILKADLPNLDRALNLDGGPSTGLIYRDITIENPNPVRNFIRKKRE